MRVRTTWSFQQPPEAIWPWLCNSRMEPTRSCLFGLGLPRPEECRLPGGGGVGSTRQCVSDRGVIEQTILAWEEPRHLAFCMADTDLYFRPCVTSIVEDFRLRAVRADLTQVTRTTTLEVIGWFRLVKQAALWVGVKKIHRFVFANWERLAGLGTGGTGPGCPPPTGLGAREVRPRQDDFALQAPEEASLRPCTAP